MTKVYLIGAGPGDPGLLTLRGRDILSRADVLVYDYLANSDLLDFAKAGAEIIYAGKRGGEHALSQDEINLLIIKKAGEGKTVARLKGGDPFMFGRGGEEARELALNGVPFEVVPGVTSPIAAAAYAGIPLTHRSYSSSVIFAAGHEDACKQESAHNWEALAKSGSTLVFFMGMKNLPEICSRLLAAGLPPRTPAALIHWGTTPRHRTLVSSLKSLPGEAQKQGFTAPSLIIVGKVVNLRESLCWFEKKPLLGKGVVVTRSREQASNMASLLAEQGARVIQFPTIEIHPLDSYAEARKTLGYLNSYDWVAFTSVNGVYHFFEQLHAIGLDARALFHCKIAAIGSSTGQALKKRGLLPDFVPGRFVAESVVQGLSALGLEGRRILIPGAKVTRDTLPEQLTRAGASVDVLPLYETRPGNARREEILELMERGEIHCITFSSSSTVNNFMALIPASVLKAHPEVKFACIGPITAKTLEEHGFNCDFQPADYTIPALADMLARRL
ncbi:MAG: uroporphyrinogen-III C-methyltransferase [Deltaproteobacteria bacterium]|jgi:uroporphyrinogen III methyltransferase/synthase|nr:uroporphyrinogen-III C-methyltransferase [Deltaproteobacteria bacterium]